jgi:hypothetical protein
LTKKLHISIPQPCRENWEAMTVVEKGKFCSTCQKKVFDLTTASDKEIIEVLQNDTVACGRFTSSQLNRNLYTNQQKSSYWLVASATLLGFLGLGNHSSYAQVKHDTIQVDAEINTTVKDSINPNLPHKIKGTVSDELGPIAGVTLYLKGKQNNTYTDFDGNFEIENARLGDIIVVYYMGNKNYEEVVGVKNIYNIILKSNSNENVVVNGGICVRRTFFGRIFHKIGNLFR